MAGSTLAPSARCSCFLLLCRWLFERKNRASHWWDLRSHQYTTMVILFKSTKFPFLKLLLCYYHCYIYHYCHCYWLDYMFLIKINELGTKTAIHNELGNRKKQQVIRAQEFAVIFIFSSNRSPQDKWITLLLFFLIIFNLY